MSFKSARKNADLTQAAAAKELGVSDAAICLWERGKTMPRAAMLNQIARIYGCTVDDLLRKGDEKENA